MNICSYSNVNPLDVRGLNERFRLLFKEVCYLKANGGGGGGGSTNASDLTSGTLNDARLSANVVLANAISNSLRQSILGYKNYTVTLTQSGSSAPVATVLDDMVTGVTLARTLAGVYTLTKTAAWTVGKTIPISSIYMDEPGNIFKLEWTSANVMTLTTYAYTDTFTPADGVLTNKFISIQIYN